jgi:hypothetical protein
MPQSEQTQEKCRLAKASAEALLGGARFNFCAFELARCDDCPSAVIQANRCEVIADPMKSVVLSSWLRGDLHGPG